MARLNVFKLNFGRRTHEGAPARQVSTELQLRRSVLACLLWESQFYEDGVEIAEFVAIYWKDGKAPLSGQVKKGLAAAFPKFDEYQLAKYDRGGPIKLRDVLFLSHAKPRDEAQAEVWKKLIAGSLTTPDTWEVALSSGVDKRDAWERLLTEQKLGALALLRNLRNMKDAGVDEWLVLKAVREMSTGRVLPFRFLAAARYAPQWEEALEQAMLKSLASAEK